MDKAQYEELKKEIIAKHGPAEYDMGDAVNESARQLVALRQQLAIAQAKARKEELKAKGYDVKEDIKELGEKEYKRRRNMQEISLPLFCTEEDLKPFTEVEKDIIRLKLENFNRLDIEIGKKLGIPYQKVTALFYTAAWKLLYEKIMNQIMPLEARQALRQGMKEGDSKIITRVAEHYNVLKNEKMELEINKPIEDANAIKMLKELGDRLANE